MPDLSFHDESGSVPVSPLHQEPGSASSSPQTSHTPVSLHDSGIKEPIFQSNTLSPEHRLLLSLLRPQEQQYFTESADSGSTAAIAALARILTRESRDRKTQRFMQSAIALFMGGFGGIVASVYWLEPYPIQTLLGFVIALALLIGLALHNPVGRLERAALDFLLSLHDKRCVGLLLEQRNAALLPDQKRIDLALIRLLPELRAEDASHLTSAQRSRLHGILADTYHRYTYTLDLCLSTITAMVRIGGRGDLSALYFVASGMAATKGEQAVRTAAQSCLHDLSARLDFGPVERLPDHLKRILSPLDSPADSNQPGLYLTDADSLYALIALLPQLTSANYRQIFPQQADRDRLYSLLNAATMGSNYGYDRLKLYREIVYSLERVGDTGAIYALRQVAVMEAPTDGAKQLRSAAREALQVLRPQFKKEKVGKTLLRASQAPDTQPDELLRAAAPAESATPPEELLRPSIPQQEQAPITAASLAKAVEALRRQSQLDDGP